MTVGSQMPFDRLTRALDAWAGAHPEHKVFAQIGDTQYVPAHMAWAQSLCPEEYLQQCRNCDLIVAHAGMGSIITAAEFGKPIIVMPRRGALRETRNDHQVATVKALAARPGVWVAMDEEELVKRLTVSLGKIVTGAQTQVSASASPQMIERLRAFIVQRT